MSATRSTARARRPSKAYLRSKGLPTDSEGSGDDDQAQPFQSDSAVSVPAVVQASVSPAPPPTTMFASTPTSTPPVGNATTSVISSETHDSRNRRAVFDKRYNTSEMTDDEVLGKNLLSMVNTLLTNL
jgi:hypothetical protein